MLETRLPPGVISGNITSVVKSLEEASQLSPFRQKTDIMAVIKYASDENALELIKDGRIKILGESRVQDAAGRWLKNPSFGEFRNKISLHFIGHLQTNKADQAVRLFDSIDSLDSLRLAGEIDKSAGKRGKKLPVMIQVKISGSGTQHGLRPDELSSFMSGIRAFNWLSPRGIMAIAPDTPDEKVLNDSFSAAKKIYDSFFGAEANADGHKNYFSAGMSGDFETAVRNGSNLVRLGSLFFRTTGEKHDGKS